MLPISDKRFLMLRPFEIQPPCHKIRENIDPYDLKLLADSIAINGIIVPLTVRKLESGEYELISGFRRLEAALLVGIRRVPCFIIKVDDQTAALYSVMENLHRSNLHFFEEAKIINEIINKYSLTIPETAVAIGISPSSLSSKLRLLYLTEKMQGQIMVSGLSEGQARALLRLPEYERQKALNYIISNGLTKRQTEEYILALLNIEKEPIETKEKPPVRRAAIGDIRLFSNSLSKLVDTLKNGGISASCSRRETEKHIEFKVKIEKNLADDGEFKQLKIC